MSSIGIVFARMDSQRFPGKALSVFRGRPLIHCILQRAARSRELTQVVLATTDRSIDDQLAQTAIDSGFAVFRGSLNDVAGRAISCARHFQASTFARINGDSPFIDIKLLDMGLKVQRETDALLVSNLIPTRTYPYGVAVECISTEKFTELYANTQLDKDELEHITKSIYVRKYNKIIPLPPFLYPCPNLRLTIDVPEDLVRLNSVKIYKILLQHKLSHLYNI